MKMTQSMKPSPTQDDQLADFTDRVLDGKTAALASSDAELRALEDTTLRMSRVFPPAGLDERKVRSMQADFKKRLRKADAASTSFWSSPRTRQRFGLALAVIAVIAAVFLITPFLVSGGGDLTASAGTRTPGILGLSIILVGILLFAFWQGRRK
jgi:hypothetical protein